MTAPQASPTIIIASLMRLQGTTGVQAHMREFLHHLQASGQPHAVATPFFLLSWPLLAWMILVRMGLEWCWKPAAVWLYRQGHAAMLSLHLGWLMTRHPSCVVYAQCPLSARVALRWARGGQRVALVVHFNGSQADEWVGKGMLKAGGRLDQGIRATERDTLTRLHGLVFVSEFMRDSLSRQIPGLAKVPAAVIPNFVQRLDGAAMPDMVGRDLIAIGTLEPRKNQAYLLEVLGHAKRAGKSISLTLVGDGPDREALVSQAQSLGVQEQVRFMGFHPQARQLIAGHKLCVHAALMENLPMALIESMSAGVPVVAAAVGGIPEIFADGVEGCFWPLDNAEAGARVLMSLLGDPERLHAMSLAARRRFDARFEVNAVAGELCCYLLQLKVVTGERPSGAGQP
jgi:glycosyltransferase involved in cell wall biosynthesis